MSNTTVSTSMANYFCSESTACPIQGYKCHYNKYCMPDASASSSCTKENAKPFVARISNTYTYFCDIPNDLTAQATEASQCAPWETFHYGACLLKECNTVETACRQGEKQKCQAAGVMAADDLNCFISNPHSTSSSGVSATSMASFYCKTGTACPLIGYSCHYNKYCIPDVSAQSGCGNENSKPFVARLNNTYTYFCDIPQTINAQASTASECASWETYHAGYCFLNQCTAEQKACKDGNDAQCKALNVQASSLNCFSTTAHGSVTSSSKSPGMSGGEIAGTVVGSLAGLALLGAAAFFFVRRSKKNKAATLPHANEDVLPVYKSSENVTQIRDEKPRI
ncbi:hypothetical protein K493DRAFT_385096 [Basidiobolus meristosporus CBS 931.73]|uniref:Uncharacterized protein n=1 Tax=Basidiobolus meristosporus CBS 931.73 TaxID=1314790 RepID=A0A1Y1XS57_9FUNG|nr:hypothetical protein K493DRAFT_385096 [Basidiobolus meristosporus CBS 931.73]|eukprot:ORX88515.1 hypothetical protein K493DRAFT_385096 [Basidiobolus meristosporus CBS 931.73]